MNAFTQNCQCSLVIVRELYEKNDPNRLDKVEEEVQHQVDLGHDLKTYYELQVFFTDLVFQFFLILSVKSTMQRQSP